MKPLGHSLFLFAFFLVLAGFGAPQSASAQDWNQWRGPERNGIAPSSPTLAASWPEKGPKQLWKSEPIPSDQLGGFSSVSIAGGRAYLYVNWKDKVPTDTARLNADHLRSHGWSAQKLPDDLAKDVEAARTSDERTKLNGKDLEKWINDWVAAHLTTEPQKKLTAAVRERLQRGAKAWPLDVLDKLTPQMDKEFANAKELEQWLTAQGLADPYQAEILKAVPKTKDVSQDVILCLDADTGKTLWKKSYPGVVSTWGSSSTPAVVGDCVYVAGAKTIYCLATADGKEIWQVPAGGGGISSSPLVVDGVVVVLAGPLTGLDAASGKTLWTQAKLSGNNPSAVAWKTPAKTYVIANGNGGMACVDPKTGKVAWTLPGGGSSTPSLGEGCLVLLNQNLEAYKLSPDQPQEKPDKPLWSLPFKDRGTTPIIYQGHVYGIGNEQAFCVRLSDGKVMWQEKFGCEIASPILADGKLMGFANRIGTFLMIKAAPEKFDLFVKTKALKMASCSSPVVNNGRLYLREDKAVACYDLVHPGMDEKPEPPK